VPYPGPCGGGVGHPEGPEHATSPYLDAPSSYSDTSSYPDVSPTQPEHSSPRREYVSPPQPEYVSPPPASVSSPSTHVAARPQHVALLPVRTLWLAARFALPLMLWFSAGQLGRYLLIQGGITISHGSHEQLRRIGALIAFALLVLVLLAATVGMLSSLRPGLRSLRRPLDEPFADVLGRTLLPFVIIYLAWGLFLEDVSAFERADLERYLLQDQTTQVAGRALNIESLPVGLVAVAVAWVLRFACERWYERRGGRTPGLATAFFELVFNLFAINSIVVLVRQGREWITGRVFWVTLVDELNRTLPPALSRFWEAYTGSWLPVALTALTLPMIWFSVAALVYGMNVTVDDHQAALAGTRLERAAGRIGTADAPTRGKRATHAVTAGFRERWVPFLQAFRFTAQAGLPAFGMFCLCWAVIGFGSENGFRAVLQLIGPERDPTVWRSILVPVEFGAALVEQMLRVALLAATFDLVISHIRAKPAAPAGPAAGRAPGPTRSAAQQQEMFARTPLLRPDK
jgi:hypothetical protein